MSGGRPTNPPLLLIPLVRGLPDSGTDRWPDAPPGPTNPPTPSNPPNPPIRGHAYGRTDRTAGGQPPAPPTPSNSPNPPVRGQVYGQPGQPLPRSNGLPNDRYTPATATYGSMHVCLSVRPALKVEREKGSCNSTEKFAMRPNLPRIEQIEVASRQLVRL